MKRKKVLFLITKSNWGGAQRYVCDLATNLTDEYEVVVALGGDGELVDTLHAAGVRTVAIGALQRDISIRKELAFMRELWQILRRERPDILHVNSSKAGGVGAFLGRIAHIPRIVFTAHGWAFNEDRPVWQKYIIAFFHWLTILLAHRTIAVSRAVKSQMRWPCAERKMRVIHIGRDKTELLARVDARTACIDACPALAPHHNDFWTGTIAELHPIKQHHVAIDAVGELVSRGHTIRHLIIGDGSETQKLQQQIEECGLNEYVFILGHIHEAARLLAALDIFVLPSRSEAIGYTIIEAAHAGVPIIASNVGGIPEVISDAQDGILIPSGDHTALAAALETLITDPARRAELAQSAQIRSHKFSLERMVGDTIAVYNE